MLDILCYSLNIKAHLGLLSSTLLSSTDTDYGVAVGIFEALDFDQLLWMLTEMYHVATTIFTPKRV